MEPLTLTVAALLAKSATEALGSEAGKGMWTGLQRLRDLVGRAFASSTSLDRLDPP